MTINAKAKAVGKANLSISSGQVLANDGSGTSVLTGKSGATINILEALPVVPQPKQVPLPSAVLEPSTTVIYVTTTEFITTTPQTCECCNVRYLPNIFLKVGHLTFDSASLSLILLIILLIISAALSIWGFWEGYIDENASKKKTKLHSLLKKKK